MRKIFTPLLVFCFFSAGAQNWLKDMYDPQVNFYTVQHEFNAWWAVNGHVILTDTARVERERGESWKIYRRWEHDVAPFMVARNGNRLGTFNTAEASFYRRHRLTNSLRSTANWTYIGNMSSFNDDDATGDSCTGRLNCVRFDPNNPSSIYCGAPSGGLWKSPDFGHTWQLLNTDNLPQIGVSDVVINPMNPNSIYIATGDIANSATFSIGVLKSNDGGLTWDTTGLSWTVAQGYLIARLLISPNDTNTLIAATNAGVFRSIDGGNTWTSNTSITGLTAMEFNPANPQTIYTCGIQLYKSVDGANTWQQLTNGLPDAQSSGGFAIGLTPADTSCVYVLVSDTAGSGSYEPFYGIYRSLNGGSSFTLQSNSPDPSSTGTQGLYDLVVTVSPTDRNQLVMAGVESAFSSDGGVTWTSPSLASHVDHHDLRFYGPSGDTVFSCDDGGLFISTDKGNTWEGLNDGIHIGQIYNVSSSTQTKYLYLTGRQDEGTMLQDTSNAQIVFPGDGLECLVDPTNQSNMFFSSEDGIIANSPDGGQTGILIVNNFTSGVNGEGTWNTPFAIDPQNDQTLYVAKDYVYKSTDNGSTWNALNSPTLSQASYYTEYYLMLSIAPSNDLYIYAGTYYDLYRSADGGNTWTNITAGLTTPFFCMAVSESDPEEIWVGTDQGHIYKSINAGGAWSDFSTGLPVGTPFYPQTIAPVKNSPDALYTGLYYAGGVYYRDSTMSQWMPYSNGLPNVSVNQIEVDYCAGKIRAATYGRDLWESDPYLPIYIPPVAAATYAVASTLCTDTIHFMDNSSYSPTSWQWYFPGGQPDTSTSENPSVTYPANGTYTATFIASNSAGSDTLQLSINTSPCLGIYDPTAGSSVRIQPNPNNGSFILSIEDDSRGSVSFTVFDNVGQSMYESTATKSEDLMKTEFSLSGVSDGVYQVRIVSGGNSSVQKLVISN